MVAPAKPLPDLQVGHVGVFMAKENGKLAGAHNRLLAALGNEIFRFEREVLRHGLYDVVGRELLLFQINGAGHYPLGQSEVYVAIVHHGIGHDGIDDAFQFAHAALHILGNKRDYVFREGESVALDFGAKDIAAQIHVGAFHLCHHAPFEACEHALLDALEEHGRAVAGDDDLPAVLLQMVEDVEKCELRLGRRDFLNVVDNQDIDGLIEVDEIVLRVLAHRLRVLRLEHVRRNKQHAHLRVQLLGAHADGIGEVRLSHARRPVEEEGVETAATGIFGNIKPHGARKAVGFAFKEVVERI